MQATLDKEVQQFSLLNMEMTIDTFGLFLDKSCSHYRPTCMHLKISISKHGSDISGSIKASMSSVFCNFHAWRPENRIKIRTINTKTYKKQEFEESVNRAYIICTNGTFGQDQEPSLLKCQDELQIVAGLSAFFTV